MPPLLLEARKTLWWLLQHRLGASASEVPQLVGGVEATQYQNCIREALFETSCLGYRFTERKCSSGSEFEKTAVEELLPKGRHELHMTVDRVASTNTTHSDA